MSNWLAVASADHVRVGRKLGFMQISHGRAAPLRRIQPGDRVVCYSPTDSFRGNDPLQAFTALGYVRDGGIYRAPDPEGSLVFRLPVTYLPVAMTPIKPLLDTVVLSPSTGAYASQSDKGEMVIGAALDLFPSYAQRGSFGVTYRTTPTLWS